MKQSGFAGILSHPENIPSLVACVLALAGAGLTLPRLIRYCRKTYHSMPALNRRLTKEEQEELVEHVEIRERYLQEKDDKVIEQD